MVVRRPGEHRGRNVLEILAPRSHLGLGEVTGLRRGCGGGSRESGHSVVMVQRVALTSDIALEAAVGAGYGY